MCVDVICIVIVFCFFFQAEDGIRDLVRSRGLGDVYKRQENAPSKEKVAHQALTISKLIVENYRIFEKAVFLILSLIHI